jgi:hypothetical protein
MKTELKVEYKSRKMVDPDLDDEIEKAFDKLGFKWWASGYDPIQKVRDLAFERDEKKKKKN